MRIRFVALALLLSACSTPPMEVTQVLQTPSGSGIEVAAELQKRYDETIRMCNGAPSQPFSAPA
ncbi:hypothetical protein LOY52_21270 [Pseudomonas sp. B21-051]|uniref:hypothetical protein n=1 Tax=Pseudomonas sp. B21-051 TaxID=2895491 RepID=UPI00215E1D6F|nr:hypothetical protein [Pseudomonas sp. B21-051]UVK87367.1 hypothetical protein LOY52_21270 [Pseudomonas sp. B21-051]